MGCALCLFFFAYVLPYHSTFLHTHFENLGNVDKSRHKLPQHLQYCVGDTDLSGQNWSDMFVLCRHVATCRQHFQLRLPFKQTTQQLAGSSTTTSNHDAPKPWTCFHWLCCRDSQGQFRYYWGPGINNRADYRTKHHCAAHHIEKRPEILTSKRSPSIYPTNTSYFRQRPCQDHHGRFSSLMHTLHNRGTERVR